MRAKGCHDLHAVFLMATVFIAIPAFALCAEQSPADPPTAAQFEFFEKRIRPLFVQHCYKCHSATAEKIRGGLQLDSRAGVMKGGDTGPSVIPGQPGQSELIRAVRYDPDGYQMPPSGKLADQQIADLTSWVADGAVWPQSRDASSAKSSNETGGFDLAARAKHWSFQPLTAYEPPSVERSTWPRTPVDSFILRQLESAGITPAEQTDKRTWLRRVYFTLIGLPPSSAKIDAFLMDDSPLAYERVVDQLLASPHYGERWGRHWLDLVRFAETAGNEFDYEIPFAWKYRDYVIRAFNADLPYDRFVVEHIAGDLLKNPRRDPVSRLNESALGTGFFWLGQAMQSPIDVLGEQYDTIENQIDVMCKTFLGLTVACARCHDHKFDPISTRDYYSLVGYLRSSRRHFAFIDPVDSHQKLLSQIAALDAENRAAAESRFQQQMRVSIEHVAENLLEDSVADSPLSRYLDGKATDDEADILYPWVLLSLAESSESFLSLRKELIAQLDAVLLQRQAMTFENFDGDYRPRWAVTGEAFTGSSHEGWDLPVDTMGEQPIARVIPAGIAHSARVDGRLRGVLRSPTFTIEKDFIDYHMFRVAGSPKVPKIEPGDIKVGQVHLILDGLHLIRHPIYNGLTIDVQPGDAPKWYRQDVSKWIGHRAYIEISDEDNGFIAVDRIEFTNEKTPPTRRNNVLAEMLSSPAVTSKQELARGYQRFFSDTLRLWEQGLIGEDSHAIDRLAILNWFLEHGTNLFGTAADVELAGGRIEENEFVGGDDISASDVDRFRSYFDARRRLTEQLHPPTRAIAMADGTGEDAHVLIRGNHERPGEVAHRRFLEVFGHADSNAAPSERDFASDSGRLRLAEQMIDDSNPLVARVIVNRIWLHHFGRGLVPTPDDFGMMGQPPSHPELLDFLATELIRSGWSLKKIHRLLALSSTARMSSAVDEHTEQLDPGNRLFHRMPVRRLEGEVIRDAMLTISERLDRRMSGPGVLPFLTPFMEGRGRPEESGPLDGDGRRSIYINVRRNFLTPMFLVFDYPVPQSTVGQRAASNVPAQALTMMNNPFFIEQAQRWAERMLAENSSSPRTTIDALYESAFGRPPTGDELSAALEFLAQSQADGDGKSSKRRAWTDLCHVLINSREFIFVR